MELKIVDFHGHIKWMVTAETIYVDPLHLDELLTFLQQDKAIQPTVKKTEK